MIGVILLRCAQSKVSPATVEIRKGSIMGSDMTLC
jgi:hypothetical protein